MDSQTDTSNDRLVVVEIMVTSISLVRLSSIENFLFVDAIEVNL